MPGAISKTELKKDKLHWNLAVSEFITHLIAVKRGLNGRATPALGIPASSISRPLPSELVSWLDKLTQEYSSLAQEADRLVAEQNGLAQGLASHASWAGSRTWARAKWLLTLKKDERQARNRMLDETVDLLKSVEEFRRLMLQKKPDALPKAMTEATRLAKQWVGPFASSILATLAISEKLKELKEPKEEKKAVEETKPAEIEKEKPKKNIQEPQNKFTKIVEELPSILLLVRFLKQNQLSNPKINDLDGLVRQLFTVVAAWKQVSESEVPASVDLNKVQEEIEKVYQAILVNLEEFLGPGDVNSWVKSLPDDFKKESLEVEAFQVWQGFQKIAKRSVMDWVKEKWMSFNPDLLERLSLDILQPVQELDDLLEQFMDLIEKGDKLDEESLKTLAKSGLVLIKLLNQILTLSQFAHLDLRRDIKKTRRGPDNITELDFRELRITKMQIEQFLSQKLGLAI